MSSNVLRSRTLACLMILATFLAVTAPTRVALAAAHADSTVAMVKRAEEWYRAGNTAEARRLLMQAQAMEPGWFELTYNLAVLAQAERQYTVAAGLFRQYAFTVNEPQRAELIRHAMALEDYAAKYAEWEKNGKEPRGGLPWWAITLIAVGGVLVLAAAVSAAEEQNSEGNY